jgi:diguanylate cyclase
LAQTASPAFIRTQAAVDPVLAKLSDTLPAAHSIEQLTRPLLEMLGTATGLESTYLATIDLDAGEQHVRYARNTGAMQIPEGLTVPWSDTLCKRALDEGRMASTDVAVRWRDSEAAQALGIKTYVSAPIRGEDGSLLGTLCAASGSERPINAQAESLLELFSGLVASFIQREKLLADLQSANLKLSRYALSDELTGLPNRRALVDALQRLLARGVRESRSLLVGVIDLDGFKAINDRHGHGIGDRFLQSVAQRLGADLRGADMLGRLGGDEFLLLGPGPALPEVGAGAVLTGGEGQRAAERLAQRAAEASRGEYQLSRDLLLRYAGASVGVVALDPRGLRAEQALGLADARMYEVKRLRKQTP